MTTMTVMLPMKMIAVSNETMPAITVASRSEMHGSIPGGTDALVLTDIVISIIISPPKKLGGGVIQARARETSQSSTWKHKSSIIGEGFTKFSSW